MKGFISRKGRVVVKGQLVGVHWNSHQNVFSVVEFKSRRTAGKVLGYVDRITLTDCTVKIDKSKQKSVRENNRKDRHAFIVGYVQDIGVVQKFENGIYYNPYKLDSFVDAIKFSCGNVEYIEQMERVNLDYDFQNNRPNVTYC